MAERQRFNLGTIAGGLNQGAHRTMVADHEATTLRNWIPNDGRLDRRPGLTKVNTEEFEEAITNAFAFKEDVGEWQLIVGGPSKWGKMDADGTFETIPSLLPDFVSNNIPWSFRQYKNVIYGARPQAGTLQRTTGVLVQPAGIMPGASAPTLTEGAAGSLPAGTYQGVVTFFNTVTAAESNPSPLGEVTIDVDKQIEWTNIPTSSDLQVDAIRLYRTLANQEGVYYFVAQISSSTTTFTDDVINDALGVVASEDNGLPPPNVRFCEVWQERMWLSDGEGVFFSGLGLPESYSEFDAFFISPDDGHEVTGLHGFGDRLLIGKSNSVYIASTNDGLNFRLQPLTLDHGVVSHLSMKSSERFTFWFGGDNFYQTNGSEVRPIGDLQIRTFIDSIDPAEYESISAAIDEGNGIYYVCFPISKVMLAYNYQDGSWATMDMFGESPYEVVLGVNDSIDVAITGGAHTGKSFTAFITPGFYSSRGQFGTTLFGSAAVNPPGAFLRVVEDALNLAKRGAGIPDDDLFFKLASAATVTPNILSILNSNTVTFSLLFSSGPTAVRTIAPTIGFNATDRTGLTVYNGDTGLDFEEVEPTSPAFITDFFDEDLRNVLYCNRQDGDEASVYQLDPAANTDDGRPIDCEFISKYFGFNDEQTLKIVGDIALKVTPTPGATIVPAGEVGELEYIDPGIAAVLEVSIMGDEELEIAGPAFISVAGFRNWFRAPLASNGQAASVVALKIEYEDEPAVSLVGMAFVITDLQRAVPVSELM